MKNDNSNTTISSDEYFKDLVDTFPNLRQNIDISDGLHFNMERFADYTIGQIEKSDFLELKRCFDFQENKIPFINPETENAMTVSYCESLLLGKVAKTMETITKFMGPRLLKMYKDYEIYYNNLGQKHKADD